MILWRRRQKQISMPQIKKKEKLKNFNVSIQETNLKKLCYNLLRYNILDEDMVDEEMFLQVFLEDF